MKRIVIDASSAILLYKSDLFEDLIAAYQTTMAETVFKEVTRSGYPGAERFNTCFLKRRYVVRKTDQIITLPPKQFKALSGLGKGERDTIFIHLEGNTDFIIMDDGKGAGFCRDYGLPYINAIFFARILYLSGGINELVFRKKTEIIFKTGRYSQEIIDYALKCSTEETAFFMPG